MMMKVVEGGGFVAFFSAYSFAVTVYIAGGWAEFKNKMAKDFGPMPATV